ncbi:Ankyrin repeat-containing protein [Glarea lozoyensis ATCC 20868]|uniref:Ankyrin repeat-containing protein n=1 Tax=Glarea lozoyensis (strain ATCC 20868 / MF5171) TaxID=1116229 RepID=S3CMH2_GLAL2|nr:Ankyrin repeat-containing protein [Glarea lozoyensis ATCC 20868]EPE26409.1 Ankyrin repeat-containing protein [Glarea lozoyensis ATCC 20868]
MADPRDNGKEENESTEGASPSEQLIEACRRDNKELLDEIIANAGSEEAVAKLLNETKTVLGNFAYHEAALNGSYEIIDTLLDQDGFECDPISLREGDTPLHSAVRFINKLPHPLSSSNMQVATALLDMMTQAGSNPRVRNKGGLTPVQLCDPIDTELKELLNNALDIDLNNGDFIVDQGDIASGGEDDAGSASDSDFDPEEYQREKARREQGKVRNGAPF